MDVARLTIVRKKSQVLQFVLVIGFACAIGGYIVTDAFVRLNTGVDNKQEIMFIFMGIALITFGLYGAYGFYKTSVRIILEGDKLVFGKTKNYDLTKLQSAKLCGKVPALLGFPMEGTVLIFEDGSTKTIFDDFYEDIWKLKSHLDERINLQEAQIMTPVSIGPTADDAESRSVAWYKGNPLLSGRGLILWALLLYITYSALNDNRPDYFVESFAAVFVLILLIGGSFHFHYFGLSDKYLYIHNHHWFWREKTYPLSEIREIVLERPYKKPIALRVILKNYQSKDYLAGTLTRTIWLELIEDLKLSGVEIRDEVYKTSKVV